MAPCIEIFSSALAFAGGVFLTIESLCVRSRIRAQSGLDRLRDILDKTNAGKVLTDKHGKSLDSKGALQLWFAERTVRYSWVGFILVTLGFVLDLIAKLIRS